MNKYLLLRDNKQSGPYSVTELAAHGLKAYDLVWLEGKSAAWRYPSEIDELKPFAPIIEEQPFDRFYRKPEKKSIESPAKDNTRVQSHHSFQPEVKNSPDTSSSKLVTGNAGSKKVHVSLPVNSTRANEVKVADTSNVSGPSTISNNMAQEPQYKPVLEEIPSTYHHSRKSTGPVLNVVPSFAEGFEEKYKNIKQADTPKSVPPAAEKPVSKFLFRAVAAVCLLLGGALIGLIINYSSQQKKFQQLNQLVQEIKQQENPGLSKNVKNDQLSAELVTPQSPNPVAIQPAEVPVYKEELQLPPVKKEKKPVKSSKNIDSITLLQQNQEVVQAALESVEPVHKIDKVVNDLAKKNLWQLVSVDHTNYKTGVFGGISNLSIRLSNKSLIQLDQVEVEVLFLSPEKKTVNKQKIVFENVAPGEQLKIDVPKSSRGVKVDYSIKKIITKEFEVAHAGM